VKALQQHSDRSQYIMVNLANPEGGPMGSMYIRPSELKEIIRKTVKFTEVRYGKQILRLFEPADKIQALIDAHKEQKSE
jgi:hypothetical protein